MLDRNYALGGGGMGGGAMSRLLGRVLLSVRRLQ